MSDELVKQLRKDADFVDAVAYDGCWEIKETERGQRLRAAAARIEALESENAEIQHVFDMQWEAGQRAIKRWQTANPGNDHIWPDRADMVVHLMNELEALESRQRVLRAALDATVALDDLLERRRTRENPEVRRIRMPDDSLAEGPVVDMFYTLLDGVKAAADRARAALAGDA